MVPQTKQQFNAISADIFHHLQCAVEDVVVSQIADLIPFDCFLSIFLPCFISMGCHVNMKHLFMENVVQ